MDKKKTVHFISLGCPKNRVDSEVMLGHLHQEGYVPVAAAVGADLVVVNTCGFIQTATEESIDVIAEMAELKKAGGFQKLVVSGCLSQRYAPDLARELPEVDHFLGTGNLDAIGQVLKSSSLGHPRLRVVKDSTTHPRLRGKNRLVPFVHNPNNDNAGGVVIPDPDFNLTASSPRFNTQASYTRYVKISEGCSNTCAFCIIPKLRGPQRSRTIVDIVAEVIQYLQAGVIELNLIAQDLCAYGKDLPQKTTLAELLLALEQTVQQFQPQQPVWIRCLYAYPRGLSDRVIEVMAASQVVIPYLDMPLQHIDDRILKLMRRGTTSRQTRTLVEKLRLQIPNLVLRTTFITGLPGEDDTAFTALADFVTESRFDHLGVFCYSQEEDTPAALLPNQVDLTTAQQRKDTLLTIQQTISRQHQQDLVGKTLQVLVEGQSEESELLLVGRHQGQAPEIDGLVYINDGFAQIGEMVAVEIEEAMNYDLVGPIRGLSS